MGTSEKAILIYGFKIEDEEFADKLDNDEIELPSELDIAFGGSAYWGDDVPMDTYVCVKSVCYQQYLEDDATQVHPVVSAAEKKLIASFIKDHEITEANVGWWLFAEEC